MRERICFNFFYTLQAPEQQKKTSTTTTFDVYKCFAVKQYISYRLNRFKFCICCWSIAQYVFIECSFTKLGETKTKIGYWMITIYAQFMFSRARASTKSALVACLSRIVFDKYNKMVKMR